MKNISLETALKIGKWVGIVVAVFVGLWLLGILFSALGTLVMTVVDIAAMVLKFALFAAVVVGVCFVLAKVARAAMERQKNEALAAQAAQSGSSNTSDANNTNTPQNPEAGSDQYTKNPN
jgi:ABC-type transport system involved in multi-copper enzyme maturation permease subunit